jgi:hypothetical protein
MNLRLSGLVTEGESSGRDFLSIETLCGCFMEKRLGFFLFWFAWRGRGWRSEWAVQVSGRI